MDNFLVYSKKCFHVRPRLLLPKFEANLVSADFFRKKKREKAFQINDAYLNARECSPIHLAGLDQHHGLKATALKHEEEFLKFTLKTIQKYLRY